MSNARNLANLLNSSGVLTADAGVKADNITIDGTEIDLSSGDLTLDVSGDLIIDADGGDVKFKDGGVEFSQYYKDGNDLAIYSSISDGDIKFQGLDGSSVITPVTIDMSEGGRAIFNSGVALGGTGSANTLDDYEEGIHNAVATTTNDTSTALGTSGEDALQYVKIGSMVYIHGSIAVGGTSATGAIRVSLPFAPTSLSEKADISYFNITLDAGDGLAVGQFVGEVNGGVGAEIRVFATDQTSFQSDSAQSMDASCSVGIMGFYYSS